MVAHALYLIVGIFQVGGTLPARGIGANHERCNDNQFCWDYEWIVHPGGTESILLHTRVVFSMSAERRH